MQGVLFVEISRSLEYDKDSICDGRKEMSERIKTSIKTGSTKTNSSQRGVKGSKHVEHRAHPNGRITSGKPTGKPTKGK